MEKFDKYWRKPIAQVFGPAIMDVRKPQDMCRSCLSCLHWTGDGRVGNANGDEEPAYACRKFKRLPSPNTIVYGCDHYEDIDDVPF